ncbi:hypothetical protein [Actinomadura litoris]|uniref:Uncharacterized protein n=1 Tax=Actinomadura litoris TaxID=2678616 RepID=A0A7K1LAQ5_9ACTN|nr:hypothetical protein [Actinomadura litoris]MUN41510.1 hypothetical protein [Actinomadura litoris]
MGAEIMTFLLAIALPVAGIVKAWIGYRRVVAIEQWRTLRLEAALRSVDTEHRANVITACARVEATAVARCADSQRRP